MDDLGNQDNLKEDNISLQSIIEGLSLSSESLPSALPIGHLSYYSNSTEIAENFTLKPQKCDIFNKYLVYLSYGKISHRPKDEISEDIGKLPIAFLFSPELLKQINYYYPYDTGAAASGKYGENWKNKLAGANFLRYCVHGNGDFNTPCRLVYSIYRSNRQYLYGHPSPSILLQEIHEFLKADLTLEGVDQRQYSIECQTENTVDLTKYLMWVGLPQSFVPEFLKMWRNTKTEDSPAKLPRISTYNDQRRIHEPKGIAYSLEAKVIEDIIESYCLMDEN